jgi:hypothetical protein
MPHLPLTEQIIPFGVLAFFSTFILGARKAQAKR